MTVIVDYALATSGIQEKNMKGYDNLDKSVYIVSSAELGVFCTRK
jgi:hypothetical protein